MNPLLISALISAALSFGAAWQIQGWRMDSLRLEQANEKLAIEQSSRQRLADAETRVAQAQADAASATQRVRIDSAGAGRAANGVRDALANAVRAASTDLQACTGQVSTLSELLTGSTDLARRLATEADEWAIQAVTLQSAWPNPPPK